jgi:hypothetical protein
MTASFFNPFLEVVTSNGYFLLIPQLSFAVFLSLHRIKGSHTGATFSHANLLGCQSIAPLSE